MTFVLYYIELRLSGGSHSEAVSFARNMTKARRQRKEQAKRRRERSASIVTPFD